MKKEYYSIAKIIVPLIMSSLASFIRHYFVDKNSGAVFLTLNIIECVFVTMFTIALAKAFIKNDKLRKVVYLFIIILSFATSVLDIKNAIL